MQRSEDGRPTVWVVQETLRRGPSGLQPAHDTSPAEAFGARRVIINDSLKPWQPLPGCDLIRHALADYDPRADYLLLIGSPVFCGIAMTMFALEAAEKACVEIRLLYWASRERAYSEIVVPLDAMGFY